MILSEKQKLIRNSIRCNLAYLRASGVLLIRCSHSVTSAGQFDALHCQRIVAVLTTSPYVSACRGAVAQGHLLLQLHHLHNSSQVAEKWNESKPRTTKTQRIRQGLSKQHLRKGKAPGTPWTLRAQGSNGEEHEV